MPALAASAVGEPQPLILPKPQKQGGKPLMQALSDRKTSRTVSSGKINRQQLSNLLWAACGVNREDGKRTAPTAMNVRDIRIYAFLEEGMYLYDAPAHALILVAAGDQRSKVGGQADANKSAVVLVYVADYEKYATIGRGRRFEDSTLIAWSNVHVGFIAQNVYLYAASEGLSSWFRAGMDSPALTRILNLTPAQKPLYTQSVGVPATGA